MVEAIAPVAPAIAIHPVHPAQSSAPAATTTGTRNAGNVNFLTAFEQSTALQNEELLLSIGQTSASGTSVADESFPLDSAVLANLSPQALTILSEENISSASGASAGGKLTPTQLEEIVTLQDDALLLNLTETTTFTSDISLLDSASSVNLSAQAVDILNGINSGTGSSIGISTGSTLTTAQLQQIAGILAPFINEPLTQVTLTQMQNAMIAAGLNPTELSLQTYFLTMNYLAELSPASLPDGEQLALNETITAELLDA